MRRITAVADRGFTLLEVLVAVAIVAIVTVAVGLGLSGLGGSRQVQQEAERFQQHMEYACELAQLNGSAVGLRLHTDGYAFVLRQADRWQTPKQQVALAAYTLTHGVQLALSRDGQVIKPDAQRKSADADANTADGDASLQPDLVCFASGELTPFEADFSRNDADQRFHLKGQPDGSIKLTHTDVPQ